MRYEQYKLTDLFWLPEIPIKWEWRFLSQAVIEQKIKKPFGKMYPVLTLSYGDVKRKKNNNTGLVPETYDSYQMLYAGNIVMRLIDLQNDHTSLRTGLVKETGMITSAYTCLKPTENSAYLRYLLHSYDTKKVFYGFGGGVRQSIGYKDIRNLMIPIPPRTEQDQIVRYLDWQVSKINKLITAKKKQIALYEEQKFSLVSSEFQKLRMLTTVRLSLRAKKIGSGKTPRGGATVYSTEGILFIRSQNVYPSGVVTDGAYYISQEIDSEMESSRVYCGDVLLNITGGSIGRACVYDLAVPANVNQHVCIIRVDKKFLIPEFVSLYLNSKCGQDLIWGNQKPGNRQSLTFPQIGSFPIPVLSIKEQGHFVDSIMDRGQLISNIVKSINTEIDTLHELRTRIISDVVTGQIDVQDIEVPDFEMVEENDTDDSIDEDDISEEDEEQEE